MVAMTASEKKARLKERREARFLAEFRESSCHVAVDHPKGMRVRISLEGPAAHFPSIANSMKAFVPRGWKHAIMTTSDPAKRRLKLIDEVLAQALFRQGIGIPQFGETELYVIMAFASKTRRADDHNLPKAVCDWLMRHGFFTDDSQVEVHPFWKRRYPTVFADQDSTTISIVPREHGSLFYAGVIEELL